MHLSLDMENLSVDMVQAYSVRGTCMDDTCVCVCGFGIGLGREKMLRGEAVQESFHGSPIEPTPTIRAPLVKH